MFDVIVIGGGPAGISASLSALDAGKTILLIESNMWLAKKLSLTGGGRCNVTNNKTNEELIKQIHNGRFLFSSLNSFNASDIIQFFKKEGLKLKEEDRGRMFPVTDKSLDIIQVLKFALHRHENFKIALGESVEGVLIKDDSKTVVTNKGEHKCKSLIIATGGKSYPQTGSDGSGLELAKKLGHTITELYPTETAVLSGDALIEGRELQGITLKNMGVRTGTFYEKGYDMIFTHFGLSGPAILRSSEKVYFELKESKEVNVFIDILPDISELELIDDITKTLKANGKKTIFNTIKLTQTRLMRYLFKISGIEENESSGNVSKEKILRLAGNLKNFKVVVNGVRGLDYSFVTGGGVSLREVNPKTMESKIVDGLFFAGEILDLHAHTGGYNITVAFSTGHTAGKNA
jgi:predicted Rossmann fold flavoprotein